MLTPSVASGELVQSAWGNEIRDRTIQQFATSTELKNSWPDAPLGSAAMVGTDFELWYKHAAGSTGWYPYRVAGTVAVTTNSAGVAAFTHGMYTTPVWCLVTPQSGAICTRVNLRNATAIETVSYAVGGTAAQNQAVSISFIAHY